MCDFFFVVTYIKSTICQKQTNLYSTYHISLNLIVFIVLIILKLYRICVQLNYFKINKLKHKKDLIIYTFKKN